MLQTRRAAVWPSNLHCHWAGYGGITGAQDALLSETIPSDWGKDTHRRGPLLLERVMTLRGDSEPGPGSRQLPGEGQSPVGSVHSMVRSGQILPECLPGVPRSPRSVRKCRWTVGFGDVTPHE